MRRYERPPAELNLPPIETLPETIAKVAAVKKFIYGYCATKNLFGWQSFVQDLCVDIEYEIYYYDDLHRQGKYKENGIGAYCNMATQGAKNYAAQCSTLKRRVNYETKSLDAPSKNADEDTNSYYLTPDKDDFVERTDAIFSIELEFGEHIARLAQKVLDGYSLNKEELAQLKRPALKKYLKKLVAI